MKATPNIVTANPARPSFKGNKSNLPSKLCIQCGLAMSWRKRWALNWDEVKYCSDACRRTAPRKP